jgi:hypothetical protein
MADRGKGIAPPLNTTQSEMDEELAIFEDSITLADKEVK